jgi:hypothetical protein
MPPIFTNSFATHFFSLSISLAHYSFATLCPLFLHLFIIHNSLIVISSNFIISSQVGMTTGAHGCGFQTAQTHTRIIGCHPNYRVSPEPKLKAYLGEKLTPTFTHIVFGFFHPNLNP